MLNSERGANYLKQRQSRTSAQMRRLLHKGNSRKTHEHLTEEKEIKGVMRQVQVRCMQCAPLPWKVSTDIRPADGPRDWEQAAQ